MALSLGSFAPRRSPTVPPEDRVTNGRSPFVEADARGPWARRFKDLCALYADHIGGNPTVPQQSLIRRIATIDIECERVEGLLAEGARDLDFDAYSRWSGNLRRLLEQLGFQEMKRAKAPTPEEIRARYAS